MDRPGVAVSGITPPSAVSCVWVTSPQELALRPVEEILGGVGHSRHLTSEVAGIGGGFAAHGVHPLDVGHPLENTRSLGCRSEQQPGDGVGVLLAAGCFEDRADHYAAAGA